MIDEKFLNNLVSSSFYSDTLMHIIGMEKDENGNNTDLGHFAQLDKGCSISLGLDNGLEKAPNADRTNIKLRDYDIQKICNILNDNNFPAVTADSAEDTSKILVTDSGIQLPYMKPEEALSMLSDVVDVLHEHDGIRLLGFAHPKTAASMTEAKQGKPSWSAEIEINATAENILATYNTTATSFVEKMLLDAKNNALSQEKVNEIENGIYGESLYRGGTLGDKPFAVMAKVDCKNLVYGTSKLFVAQQYAADYNDRGYVAPNGKRYGFIYEYEKADNQKYWADYGIENSQNHYVNANSYETDVYEHKNKLKGIYVKYDGKIIKIADENGYISKEWKDFAILHNPVNRMENEKLVARNNVIYQASLEEKPLQNYTKREYNYASLSINDIKNRKNVSNSEPVSVYLTGNINNTNIIDNITYSDKIIIKDAVFDDISLDHDKIELQGKFKCTEKTIFPNRLKLKNAEIPEDADLSAVTNLTLEQKIKICNGVKMPAEVKGFLVELSDSYIKSTTDYSRIENLTLSGNIAVEANVKLPDKTIIKDAKINAFDFSNIKKLSLEGNVEFVEGVKLPETLHAFSIGMLKIHDSDISQLKEIKSNIPVPIIILDKENKPVATIGESYNIKFRDEGCEDVRCYPSLDAYKRCKAVEEKLTSMGIDKDSYMMITPEDNLYTSYNKIEYRSMEDTFNDCRNDLKNANTSVVYGSNNDVIAAYFAQDVYVISKNLELRDALYHKGKDTNMGIVMSNDDEFRTQYNEPYKALNSQYKKVKEWKPKEKVAEKVKDSQVQTIQLSNKEKIVALSGRTSDNYRYTIQGSEPLVNIQTTEQEKTIVLPISEQTRAQDKTGQTNTSEPQQKVATQTSVSSLLSSQPQEKVADMSPKEKGHFFHKLRMGINTILAKAEAKLSPEKTVSQTKTQTNTTQQQNIAQMKMVKNRENSV